MNDDPDARSVAAAPTESAFRSALGRHGHGFQYSLIERIKQVVEQSQLEWAFEMTELPVQVHGVDSHADVVLRVRRGRGYVVGECKRIDPEQYWWCFAGSKLSIRNQSTAVQVDELQCTGAGVYAHVHRFHSRTGHYQVAWQMKSSAPGDGHGGQEKGLEQATTQALRGSAGLANMIKQKQALQAITRVKLFPVVFTTARLFATETDLSTANLSTGRFADPIEIREVPWLWLRQNVSPSLRSDVPSGLPVSSSDLASIARDEILRTVAIVTPTGIPAFLDCVNDECD